NPAAEPSFGSTAVCRRVGLIRGFCADWLVGKLRRRVSLFLCGLRRRWLGNAPAHSAEEAPAGSIRTGVLKFKGMSTAVKQFHEEEAIGKTYDWQVARRLLRYLKPYVRLLISALILTLLLNLLGILQPLFTEWAIDGYILPRNTVALDSIKFRDHFFGSFYLSIGSFALLYLGVQFARFVFSF